jgi:hypothetical protein
MSAKEFFNTLTYSLQHHLARRAAFSRSLGMIEQ